MSLHRTFVLRTDAHTEAAITFIASNAPAMSKAGTPLSVTVAEHKSKRSVEQNARYWKLINEIAEKSWLQGKQFSSEAWHENFKREYIGTEDTPGNGTVGISTRTLSVGDFSTYMDRVQQFAAEHLGVEFDF